MSTSPRARWRKSDRPLGVRLVLSRKRYAPAHTVTNLLQQFAKSLTETSILERCLIDLALRPTFDGTFITIIRAGGATRRSA